MLVLEGHGPDAEEAIIALADLMPSRSHEIEEYQVARGTVPWGSTSGSGPGAVAGKHLGRRRPRGFSSLGASHADWRRLE